MSADLLDPNPFAKPIVAPAGNRTAHVIYTAVGLALDRWEHCENSFSHLYASLVSPRGDNTAAIRSIGSVVASSTKKEMIWHAAAARFRTDKNETLHADIRHLLNLYQDASARRNEIAHAMVLGLDKLKTENGKVTLELVEWFLAPSFFATRKRDLDFRKMKYRLSTVEIGHLTKCFEVLGSRGSAASAAARDFYKERHPRS